MLDCLIAFLLLSPVEIPAPIHVPAPVWKSLKRMALLVEVAGPHENWRSDFREEMRYVRRHYRDLKDSPRICDRLAFSQVFATQTTACEMNLAYREYIEARRQVCKHRWDDYEECLEEARRLNQIWSAVSEAFITSNSWAAQRRALRKLRDLLGPDDFYNGRLPPPAPIWRFQQH